MTYKDALKIIHAQRLEKLKLHNGVQPSRRDYLSVAERECLGARWLVLCDGLGKRHSDPLFGVVYHIETRGGTFKTHYDPHFGTIFGHFENPAGLRGTRFNPAGTFQHHGKWNFHTNRTYQIDLILESWEQWVRSVLIAKPGE